MPLPIEDYGVIGDTQTAALVGKDGSIDWLCLPWFNSGACFAALLGGPEHGRWLIAPAGEITARRRRYAGASMVLETEFDTPTGSVRVTDFMPVRRTEPDLIRIVDGIRGEVAMQMELVIRFDYGAIVPWVRRIDGVLQAIGGPDALALSTPISTYGANHTTRADFIVRAGDRVPFVLTWFASHDPVPAPIDPIDALADTRQWWEDWAAQCTYHGPWRDAVLRSLLTLKCLTFGPTGGIVAAATTSLPEQIGGVRNWDYRYCWIRDATFTLYSLIMSGYTDEAIAWRNWLLRAVAGTPASMQILYGASGERRLSELTLDWLPGYEGSRPVRVGNAAFAQHQLDVYGEMMDVIHVSHRAGVPIDPNMWAMQRVLVEFVERVWTEPDEGIWEVRGPRRHFTHSKVMAWVALDRAVKAIERWALDGPLERWRAVRAEIHADVIQRGYDAGRNTFTQFYGSRELDGSLLMLPLVGFLPATDPRMRGTVAAIEEHLLAGGLVRRYRTREDVDGLPPGEGVFLACSFWLADNYAMQGRRDDALRLFERLLALQNDLGLLSEEYDPAGRRLLGNFPQAFSHVSLINTARNLAPDTPGPAEDRTNP
ncbi:MAG TPA: glycoside hydrolase family 15 protein [Vicinamibacterales bacterium]|nr:glycoside hydrolase family 15 protein [Vicinamibacterales bacterium]